MARASPCTGLPRGWSALPGGLSAPAPLCSGRSRPGPAQRSRLRPRCRSAPVRLYRAGSTAEAEAQQELARQARAATRVSLHVSLTQIRDSHLGTTDCRQILIFGRSLCLEAVPRHADRRSWSRGRSRKLSGRCGRDGGSPSVCSPNVAT